MYEVICRNSQYGPSMTVPILYILKPNAMFKIWELENLRQYTYVHNFWRMETPEFSKFPWGYVLYLTLTHFQLSKSCILRKAVEHILHLRQVNEQLRFENDAVRSFMIKNGMKPPSYTPVMAPLPHATQNTTNGYCPVNIMFII